VFQINKLADAFSLPYEPQSRYYIYTKKIMIVCLKVTIFKMFFTCGPRPQITFVPGAELNFLIDMLYAHAQF
jgi:hypothetical protein